MNRHEKSLEFAVNYLKNTEYIKQIWLFGSTARKQNRYNSDVDLYVVLKEEYNTSKVKLLIKNEADPDDYSLPEVDVHFGIKNIEDYKCSSDFIDNSESLFIRNIKKDGIKIWET